VTTSQEGINYVYVGKKKNVMQKDDMYLKSFEFSKHAVTKREFKQKWTTIPPISTKQITTSYIKPL